MDASQDFKSLQDKVQSALVATTKSANGLAREDLSFLRTVDPAVASKLDDKTARLLRLSEDLLKSAGKFVGQRAPSIEDADDIEISWRGIVDVIDTLLEKADTCLDEYTGLIKRKDAPTAESGPASKKPKPTFANTDRSWRRANILKPQNAFERKFDNFDAGPWKPLLTTKPHATVPLDESLTTFVDDEDNTQYKHPYENEILNLEYPRRMYEKTEPVPFLPFDETSATWVDTYEGVLEMLAELKKAKEIAVDLEHHDLRSYQGLTSLMQISTREKDWIIDTLRPWRHKLEVLNEVFADPDIIKVFHGSYMDIIWLQRDLGLYIVCLFDTFYACDALNYPGKSLAFLLKKFADFDADKKYQMADWRIRPLPEEMFYYARSDTHYLLYIFDRLRNDLIDASDPSVPEKNWIEWVLQKSKEVSLQRYETPLCDVETGNGSRGWFNVLLKSPSGFTAEQFAVYRAVFKWRDDVARQEDESPHFVMPQAAVADIARVLPSDAKALWSLAGGSSRAVKARVDELFEVVGRAREKGAAGGPSLLEFYRATNSVAAVAKKVFGDKDKNAEKKVEVEVRDIKELKAERSQLWGDMEVSSRWEEPMKREFEEGEIALPWTAYVQGQLEIETVPGEAMDVDRVEENKEVEILRFEDPEGDVVPDQEFSLRQGRKKGKKRKAEKLEEEDAQLAVEAEDTPMPAEETKKSEEGETAAATEDEERKAKKAAKKAARKERRAAERLAKQNEERQQVADGEDKAQEDGDEEEPFDYSKAQTVLHASGQDGEGGDRKRRKKQKVFDPYAAKTQDAPKGARQMNYEKAGRTATFKK